jgi:hypothetical protein
VHQSRHFFFGNLSSDIVFINFFSKKLFSTLKEELSSCRERNLKQKVFLYFRSFFVRVHRTHSALYTSVFVSTVIMTACDMNCWLPGRFISPGYPQSLICKLPRKLAVFTVATTSSSIIADSSEDDWSCSTCSPSRCSACPVPLWTGHRKCHRHLKLNRRSGLSCDDENPCHLHRRLLEADESGSVRKRLRQGRLWRQQKRRRRQPLDAAPVVVSSSSDEAAQASQKCECLSPMHGLRHSDGLTKFFRSTCSFD